ncbi:hypothetical protein K491DRAFT_613332 [Lophiostoma macrostomum CBS 122681]|uniref:Uncharacterized protein n=1 Tax=Lophiostoma macrostomum CBS 122681 TaxID=1314788 RepID=A0A6A6SJW7_9PLEO|nr:hypothetical protein K491DRAFT_613332 [Lophiostoma macrostomum CBS 122681]
MTSNAGGPRRDQNPPEDNPFIAFRRFADAQVSSLFTTVFALPEILNDANHARAKCLWGQADPKLCEELRNLEIEMGDADRAADALCKDQEYYFSLTKHQEWEKLVQEVGALRNRILADDGTNLASSENTAAPQTERQRHVEMVEKTANRKGQEWGWSWDWGFPRPFDAADHHPRDDPRDRMQAMTELYDRWKRHRGLMRRIFEDTRRDEPSTNAAEYDQEGDNQSKGWASPFYMWKRSQNPTCRRIIHPRNPYSPHALEEDETLKQSGIQWRDAFEDLTRVTEGKPLIPEERLGHSRHQPYRTWARRLGGREESAKHHCEGKDEYPKKAPLQSGGSSEEPSYEYGHDHEDQHDDPPTPRPDKAGFTDGMPAMDLEAYERLLGPVSAPGHTSEASASILSTLTTTERTIAPDGTVTTKVVLKKRFADGREESSETLHTQRGQGVNGPVAISDQMSNNKDRTLAEPENLRKSAGNKKGWFWSN